MSTETTEQMSERWQKAIHEAGAATEQEMREATVPWPESEEELVKYINTLVNRPHDYGTCVYAMSMAAVAAYNYVVKKLGTSGFQASCADLDILRRNRSLTQFRILNYEHLLYPQYLDAEHFPSIDTLMADQKDWLKSQAEAKLKENENNEYVHPEVLAHWRRLAS